VEEPACTPAYVAREQAQFLAAIQASYTQELTSNMDYPEDPLADYETVLSEAGWAGCAPPLLCVDCEGSAVTEPCLELHPSMPMGRPHICHLHEEYLSPGQSNADTFRCLDGSCILQAGRCNGLFNCDDRSDEDGCDAATNHFVPAYMSKNAVCPDDFHNDVHFQCGNGQCIEKVGLCNGVDNCDDGSDEAHCSGALHVTVEATSGRQITVETLEMNTGVFHDREYNFDSLGHFVGKTFIKYSNDDKTTDYDKVMTKLRTLEPATVFIVKLTDAPIEWLIPQGFTESSFGGVSFSGVRSTRHKEWDPELLTTDRFDATQVWKKTFPAGTISIPGNGGGDGSFLVFMDWPSLEDEYDTQLQAYWESGDCGVHGNDHNWAWCSYTEGACAVTVETDLCPSGTAELAAFHGTGAQNSYSIGSCNYFYHAQYRCSRVVPEIGGEAEFVGCFVDDGSRDLGDMVGTREDSSTNTFELCRARCGDSQYMSLQFGGECFCSNSYGNGDVYEQVDESECNVRVEPCSSHSYNCGGTWRNAVYRINRIAHWEMIAHHDFAANQYELFPSSTKNSFTHNANDPTAALFMNIGNLVADDYRIDGKFHFHLQYTDLQNGHAACNVNGPPTGTQSAYWTQTSWITGEGVTGFEVISPANLASGSHGCAFTGLAQSASSSTSIDGSHDHDYWFASVGSIVSWDVMGVSGIPALFGGLAQTMTLWVQRA
jgi:hypothetical protein